MGDIEQTIRNHILKEFIYDKPEIELEDDLPLIQEGIIDSLGIFLLIGFVEEEFGIKIHPEEVVLDNFETLSAIKSLIMAKLE